ncbi:hypothetical protein [Pasteuria penetrans]|uniref:hypothetical protein n=1 Tax=Pasteuria penetrans TaxID=86005 RepID=UPI000FBA9F3B|nr:hypothetical protein [Pasteuria penetrans]
MSLGGWNENGGRGKEGIDERDQRLSLCMKCSEHPGFESYVMDTAAGSKATKIRSILLREAAACR